MSAPCKSRLVLTFELEGKSVSGVFYDQRVVLGRGADCDFVITHTSVSRQHAEIAAYGETWKVIDLWSSNGIVLNGQEVRSAQIGDGDRLRLGEVELSCRLQGGPEVIETETILFQPVEDTGAGRQSVVRLDPLLRGEAPEGAAESGVDAGTFSTMVQRLFRAAQGFDADAESTETEASELRVARALLDLLFDETGAERGFVGLYDPDARAIVPRAWRSPDGVATPIRASNQLIEEAVGGRAAVLNIEPASRSDVDPSKSILELGIQASLCAPLSRDTETIGVIYLDSRQAHQSFSAEQLQLVASLALLTPSALALCEAQRLVAGVTPEPDLASSEDEDEAFPARRRVAVLVATISGLGALGDEQEPEAAHDIASAAMHSLRDAAENGGGKLLTAGGDGLVAIFGDAAGARFPAREAVASAVVMREALDVLSEARDLPTPLRLRAGVDVGGAVLTDARPGAPVSGELIGVARYLSAAIAEPGEIVLGPATQTQLRDTEYQCEALEMSRQPGGARRFRPYRLTT